MNAVTLFLAEQAPAAGETQGFDWTLIFMLGVLALFMFFMFRSNKRRKKQMEEMQDKVQVGAEVMTNFGLFGVVQSIDEENNIVELETSPGTVIRVHRQVVTTVVKTDDPVADEVDLYEDAVDEPQPDADDENPQK